MTTALSLFQIPILLNMTLYFAFSTFIYHFHLSVQITPMEAEMSRCVVGDEVDLQYRQLGHLHSSHQEQKMGQVLAHMGEEGKTQHWQWDPFSSHNGDSY